MKTTHGVVVGVAQKNKNKTIIRSGRKSNIFMKSATDVFTQKNFAKVIFNSEICYRYDYKLVITLRVVQFNK